MLYQKSVLQVLYHDSIPLTASAGQLTGEALLWESASTLVGTVGPFEMQPPIAIALFTTRT